MFHTFLGEGNEVVRAKVFIPSVVLACINTQLRDEISGTRWRWSGQLHTLTALHTGKQSLVPIG